jgi:trans-2,3-dihydro-3-hydroxyanthranilate isomerase
MPTFPTLLVDAFTECPLRGNACIVVFEADDLRDEEMLAIAREMNLSETAFVRRSSAGDVAARYFTTAEEIPLAGHPTIATAFALVDTGRLQLQGDRTTLKLELRVGVIDVEIESSQGRVVNIVMSQKKPQFLATYDPADVLPVFGLTVEDALPGAPVQTVSTGTPQLMIPVRDLNCLRGIQVNIPAYNDLRARGDFFSPHVFCLQGVTEVGQTFARHFGTPPDLLEDPFTGSATGGMAAYLWHYRLLDQPRFVAEQGHWMGRDGQGTVEVVGPPDDIETVKVGGKAVAVMQGELRL